MPLYKIWSTDRTVKKIVVGDGLDDVKRKGAAKLGYHDDHTNLYLLLEKDGTEIDEDEALQELTNETFLLARPGQRWNESTPAKPPVCEVRNDVITPSTYIAVTPSTPIVVTPSTSTADPESESDDNGPESNIDLLGPVSVRSSDVLQMSQEILSAPLPTFDNDVIHYLKKGKSLKVWNRMVAQAAHYYHGRWPNIGDSSVYKIIGQKMVKTFPSVAQAGCHPWSVFSKNLSQKLRHIRLRLKDKSGKKGALKKTQLTFRQVTVDGQSQDETAHLEELKRWWRKTAATRSKPHIKMLLENTKTTLMEKLRENPGEGIHSIIEEFPCFEDAVYIVTAWKVQIGEERVLQASQNLKRFMFAVENLMKDKPMVPATQRMLPVVQYVEEQTKFDRVPQSKTKGQKEKAMKSIIEIKEDIADEDVKKLLDTAEDTPMHLVMFTGDNGSTVTGLYIVGDRTVIRCSLNNVMMGMFQLLAAYYLFDVNYPRYYAMLLGTLQTFVMSENYMRTFDTSKKYKFFMTKIEWAFHQVPPDDN